MNVFARRRAGHGISVILARLILGGVFVYASLYKIMAPEEFAAVIFNYRLAPAWLVNPAAIILPWLEFWLGALVISGIWLRASVIMINIFLAIFMAAIGFNLWRGLDFNCGCFSNAAGHPAAWLTLARDGILLLMGGLILASPVVRAAPDQA